MQKIFFVIFIFTLPIFITRFSVGNFSDIETSLTNGMIVGAFDINPTPTIEQTPSTNNEPSPTTSPSPTPTIELPVLINEVSPLGGNAVEWVELFNPNNFSVNLTSWRIRDQADINSANPDTIPNGTAIQANSYAVIVTSTSTVITPNGIQKITLANGTIGNGLNDASAEAIYLQKSDNSLVDQMGYGPNNIFGGNVPTFPTTGKTLSRIPNAIDTNSASDWTNSSNPTLGSTNL